MLLFRIFSKDKLSYNRSKQFGNRRGRRCKTPLIVSLLSHLHLCMQTIRLLQFKVRSDSSWALLPVVSWKDFAITHRVCRGTCTCFGFMESLNLWTRGFLHNAKHLLGTEIALWSSNRCRVEVWQCQCGEALQDAALWFLAHDGNNKICITEQQVCSDSSCKQITWRMPRGNPKKWSSGCHRYCYEWQEDTVSDDIDQITSEISQCGAGRPG